MNQNNKNFIAWYIKREKDSFISFPELELNLLLLMKKEPNVLLDSIRENLYDDYSEALLSGKVGNSFFIDDWDALAQEVFEALKNKFLKEDTCES